MPMSSSTTGTRETGRSSRSSPSAWGLSSSFPQSWTRSANSRRKTALVSESGSSKRRRNSCSGRDALRRRSRSTTGSASWCVWTGDGLASPTTERSGDYVRARRFHLFRAETPVGPGRGGRDHAGGGRRRGAADSGPEPLPHQRPRCRAVAQGAGSGVAERTRRGRAFSDPSPRPSGGVPRRRVRTGAGGPNRPRRLRESGARLRPAIPGRPSRSACCGCGRGSSRATGCG